MEPDILSQKNVKEETEALRLMSLVGDKQIELDGLQVQVEEAKKTLGELEKAQEALDGVIHQIALAEELLASHTQKTTALTKQVDGLAVTKTSLKEEVAALKEEVTARKEEAHTSKEELENLKKELEEQKLLETKRIEEAQAAHLAKLDQLAQEKQEAEAELVTARAETTAERKKLTDTRKKLTVAQEGFGEAELAHKLTMDELAKEVFALQEIKTSLTKEQDSIVQKAQEAVATLAQAKDTVTAELKTLQNELGTVLVQKTEAQSFVETKLSEIASAKRTALIEISTAMSQARMSEASEQLAGAINSINDT